MTRRCFIPVAAAIPAFGLETGTRLVFGGDVILCRYIGEVARQKKDAAWAFRELAPFLTGADIAFANLESPFSDKGQFVNHGMVFKAEPEMSGYELAIAMDIFRGRYRESFEHPKALTPNAPLKYKFTLPNADHVPICQHAPLLDRPPVDVRPGQAPAVRHEIPPIRVHIDPRMQPRHVRLRGRPACKPRRR